jgi:uncharacterized protein involved in exopolysaccharide biosynthesis
MQEVSHEQLHSQISDLDKRLIRMETAMQHVTEDGRETSKRLGALSESFAELRSSVIERLARMEGGLGAVKWGLPVGLSLVTAILAYLIKTA